MKKPTMVSLLILLVLSVVVSGEGITLAASMFQVVPNVVGMPVEQAKQQLSPLKIHPFVVEDTITSDQSLVGKVASQSKPAGKKELVPTTIKLHVYKKGQGIAVPNVVGKTMEEAKKLLFANQLALQYGSTVRTTDPKLANLVAGQEPKPGVQVQKGASVKLDSYITVQAVTVPNVVGTADDVACRILSGAGFSYKHQDLSGNDPAAFGKVMRQEPAAGSSVARGTQVTIWIGRPGNAISVPKVTNMFEKDAIMTLSKAKLLPFLTMPGMPTTNISLLKRVAQQTPAAGESVPPNTKVHLKLYVEDKVRVPNLHLMPQKEALDAIQKAGFSAVVQKVKMPLSGFLGKVQKQNPDKGEMVLRGSKVTIWVGER